MHQWSSHMSHNQSRRAVRIPIEFLDHLLRDGRAFGCFVDGATAGVQMQTRGSSGVPATAGATIKVQRTTIAAAMSRERLMPSLARIGGVLIKPPESHQPTAQSSCDDQLAGGSGQLPAPPATAC